MPCLPPHLNRRELIKSAAGFLLVSGVAASVLGNTAAFAAGPLPQITRPRKATNRISLVGDSLTSGAEPYQDRAFASAGWSSSAIDAYRSRGVLTKIAADPHNGITAVDAIRAADGDTDVWVVALGTNDAGIYAARHYPDVINAMVDHIGSQHVVVWVNIYLPETPARQDAWNFALGVVAAERPGLIVFDWATVAAANPDWIGKDKIHYSPIGYEYRANAVALATAPLAPDTSQPISSEDTRRN